MRRSARANESGYDKRTRVFPLPIKRTEGTEPRYYKHPVIRPVPRTAELDWQIMAMLQGAGMADKAQDFTTAFISTAGKMLVDLQIADPHQEYSPAEAEALQRGGATVAANTDAVARVTARTAAKYAALYATSRSTGDVARMIHKTDSRIRQLCLGRKLYGYKVHGEWYLPDFQFAYGRPIPGLDAVIPRLAPTLSLIAVYNWFTHPNPNLADDDGPPMSPRDWLVSGHSPELVGALAAEL